MAEWDAEVRIDEPLVRRLVAPLAPDLVGAELEPLAEGWDNAVWLVGRRIVFRFPRRAVAVAGVERESAVLPRIARRLPLPIPEPIYVGQPGDAFPWPFFGARYLPGSEIAETDIEGRRAAFGAALGRFLRALHALDVTQVLGDEAARSRAIHWGGRTWACGSRGPASGSTLSPRPASDAGPPRSNGCSIRRSSCRRPNTARSSMGTSTCATSWSTSPRCPARSSTGRRLSSRPIGRPEPVLECP